MAYIGSYPIPVVRGGTGAATLTSHGVLSGEGTAAISATSAGTAGQLLLSGGSSADPSYVTPTAGTGLSVTTNATTLSYVLSSPLSAANGGTGSTSFISHEIILGGSSSLGAATNGQIPIGSTPVLATIIAGSGILITNGAGSITISSPGAIATINGNTGSATGSTVTITTGASNANGTSNFAASGSTVTFSVTGAGNNIGIGSNSMTSASLTGTDNTCMGYNAGTSITSGSNNTLLGFDGGTAITTGSDNTVTGFSAGLDLVGGNRNCLMGYESGESLTSGSNNCYFNPSSTGYSQTTGSYNVAFGQNASNGYGSSESSNILFSNAGTVATSNTLMAGSGVGTGSQQLAAVFISGITGITVTGNPILVSSGGQLGIAVSSRRFKNNIKNMGKRSEGIYKLRPVTFLWDKDSAPGLSKASNKRQCGLIAEEVATLFPSLVTFDKDNKPLSVNYSALFPLLINELKKLVKRVDYLENN